MNTQATDEQQPQFLFEGFPVVVDETLRLPVDSTDKPLFVLGNMTKEVAARLLFPKAPPKPKQ